jgi:diguanylate cyclase (GGDEF)-like protein/PAS domain S-box-containing protein
MHMHDTNKAPDWRSQPGSRQQFSVQDWLLMLLLTLYLIFVAIWLFADASLAELLAPWLEGRDSGWRDWLFASVTLTLGLPVVLLYRRQVVGARHRLEESETQLRSVFDNTSDAIVILNDGQILRINHACLSMFGYSSIHDIGDRPLASHVREQDLPRLRDYLQQVRSTNVAPAPCELKGIRRDGGEIAIEIRACPVKLGKRPAMIVWIRDITDRAVYEDNLRKSAAYYRALFDENPQMMCLHDIETTQVLAVNRAMLDTYGYSASEIHNVRVMDMVALRMLPELKSLLDTPLNGSPRSSGLWETYARDGRMIEVEVVAYDVDFGNRPARLIIAEDVTEKRRLQREWRETQARIERLFHSNMLAVGFLGEDGRLLDANALCLDLAGLRAEDIATQKVHWRQLFPVDEAAIRLIRQQLLAHGKSEPAELNMRQHDGSLRPVLVGSAYLPGGGGMFYAIDISERKQIQAALAHNEAAYRQLFEHAPVSLWEEDMSEAMAYVDTLLAAGVTDITAHLLADRDACYQFWRRVRITHVNRSTLQLLGANSVAELGREIRHIMTANSLRDFARIAGALAEGRDQFSSDTEYRRLDGEVVHVAMNWVLPGGPGKYGHLIAALTDISEIKRANDQLQKLSLAVEQSGNIVMMTDANGVIDYVNSRFEHVTGYLAAEIVGQGISMLDLDENSRPALLGMLRAMLQGEEWHGELNLRRKDGELFWCLLTVAPVRQPLGAISHHVIVAEDISERKFAESTIRHLAFYDPLTELPNRRLFRDRIEVMANGAMRERHSFGLLYMDLDRFKTVNDTLGHSMGDRLLLAAARRMQSFLRKGDTLARLGGDEFALIIADLEHADNLVDVAEKLIDVMRAPVELDGHSLFVSVSIGIAIYPQDCDDSAIDSLIKNADVALYRAKEAGRNTFQFYRKEMNARAMERLLLESRLRGAIEREEFVLHYQPQVELDSGRIVGVEALLRWQSADLGLLMPMAFIPLAEETGLIVPIGEWVMLEACRQLAQWRAAGLPVERVAVNLSARQMHVGDVAQQINRILDDCGLPPGCLDIEITESLAMEQPERTRALLLSLKQRGITLSMDDFGTGYSSLGYLKQYPLDVLKIDRSFVRDIATDPNDAAIVSTIIAMARSLNLTVLGEGIETEAQRQFLLQQGCRHGQGYLFGRPVSAAEMEALLSATQQTGA